MTNIKEDLLCLIEQMKEIQPKTVLPPDVVKDNELLYSDPEFIQWKQNVQFEIQEIYDRTKDKYIWNVLVLIKQQFNGWNDIKSYYELSSALKVIIKNESKYFPENEVELLIVKKQKIFISHSSKDKDLALELVNLFLSMGFHEQDIFCSSAIGFGIPIDEDIYEYLKKQFQNSELHVIFLLSENYYESIACLNEMGAAWVLQSKYTSILAPDFNFKNIDGAINPRQMSIKLDSDIIEIKEKLGQLKNDLLNEFNLPHINDIRWEKSRNEFIEKVSIIN